MSNLAYTLEQINKDLKLQTLTQEQLIEKLNSIFIMMELPLSDYHKIFFIYKEVLFIDTRPPRLNRFYYSLNLDERMIKFVKKYLCKIIEKFSTKSEREIKKLNFQYDEEWEIFIQEREHTL
jgi:hypothetical protein